MYPYYLVYVALRYNTLAFMKQSYPIPKIRAYQMYNEDSLSAARSSTLLSYHILRFPIKSNIIWTKTWCWHRARLSQITTLFCSYSEIMCVVYLFLLDRTSFNRFKKYSVHRLTMAKFDANKEAFQMRAQWKKQDICKKMWFDRWSWLLDERK